jgi:hypothetical protein
MSDVARRILLGIFLIGAAGVTIELWLLGHYEELEQFIPLGLAGIGVVTMAVAVLKPSPLTVRLLQAAMVLMVISGFAGVWFHYQATTEFQLEMDASLRGWALFRKAIVAKAPPALAPGSMIQLGLIGLAYTFRHPVSRGGGPSGPLEEKI